MLLYDLFLIHSDLGNCYTCYLAVSLHSRTGGCDQRDQMDGNRTPYLSNIGSYNELSCSGAHTYYAHAWTCLDLSVPHNTETKT